MAQTNIKFADIQGLAPAVEPTRSKEVFILSGRNYVFDTIGPNSVFGNRMVLPQPLGRPNYTQGVRIYTRQGRRVFVFTSDSILEWDENAGAWQVIYITSNTGAAANRWTWGYLGGVIYFCHPVTGILVLDPETGICQPHNGPGVPSEALAITVSNGRLGVIDPLNFSWSAPNDGMNFTPELGGAGFQLIGSHVSGFPIMITGYSQGVLIWTGGGVMRSEFTGDQSVYRHRPLQTAFRPVNSFCTCRLNDDTVVILDERGLFQSKGEAPIPWTPIFNEFIGAYIRENKLRLGENLRIEWDELNKRLYVSVSLSFSNPRYETCFVLYPDLDKWGQFNESHFGIIPIQIEGSVREGDYQGFVDTNGSVRYWNYVGSRELAPSFSVTQYQSVNLYYPPTQKPPIVDAEEGGIILSSSGILNTIPTTTLNATAGYFHTGETSPLIPVLTGLDAEVTMGLVRVLGDEQADQLGEVINMMVRSVQSGPTNRVGEDYNIAPPPGEDYNIDGVPEDYGFQNLNYVNHGLELIGTIDGVTTFVSATPELVGFVQGARYYSCIVPGLWHIVKLTATEIGEAFHPATVELTATNGGRLL